VSCPNVEVCEPWHASMLSCVASMHRVLRTHGFPKALSHSRMHMLHASKNAVQTAMYRLVEHYRRWQFAGAIMGVPIMDNYQVRRHSTGSNPLKAGAFARMTGC
jgi:hypothetical protein